MIVGSESELSAKERFERNKTLLLELIYRMNVLERELEELKKKRNKQK